MTKLHPAVIPCNSVIVETTRTLRRIVDSWSHTISGYEAFVLHDRYGFPVELTQEIAAEHGMDVDMDEFRALMSEHRRMSK